MPVLCVCFRHRCVSNMRCSVAHLAAHCAAREISLYGSGGMEWISTSCMSLLRSHGFILVSSACICLSFGPPCPSTCSPPLRTWCVPPRVASMTPCTLVPPGRRRNLGVVPLTPRAPSVVCCRSPVTFMLNRRLRARGTRLTLQRKGGSYCA